MIDIPPRQIVLSMTLVLGVALSACGASARVPRAAPQVDRFDGPWSVVIITDSGTCDRAYRYGLRIEGGRVYYAGESGVQVSGQVDARGRVSVVVRSGESMARGSGRLADDSGEGSWQGRSQDSTCSGRWQAERGR